MKGKDLFKWEYLDPTHRRSRVPFGWIVEVAMGSFDEYEDTCETLVSAFFYPDEFHQWLRDKGD